MNPKAPCFIRDEEQSYIYLILPVNFNAAAKRKRGRKRGQKMETIKLRTEYIKLGQGAESSRSGGIRCGCQGKDRGRRGAGQGGAVELQRGKKLYDGDVVSFHGEEIRIEK